MTQSVPVLVNADTIYSESRRDYPALLFWRTATQPAAGVPLALQQPPPRPAWAFFQNDFTVYPVIEAYQQFAGTVGVQPNLRLFTSPPRYQEAEFEIRRTDHQLYFQVARPYALQITFYGVVLEIPDLNETVWQEWVHPPTSPESALFPFRQIPTFVRGQQFNLYYGQPPSPRLDPEADKLRPFDAGIMLIRQAKQTQAPLTTCGRIDVYDYGNGAVLMAWGPFIGGIPDSYNIYVNGVLNQNVPTPLNRQAVVTGLFGASYNGVTVTPATTYALKVVAVSAGIEVSESDTLVTAQPTSVMLVTPMKRIWPFPNSGLD